MIKLTLKEQERLTQYLSWVDITSESLSIIYIIPRHSCRGCSKYFFIIIIY